MVHVLERERAGHGAADRGAAAGARREPGRSRPAEPQQERSRRTLERVLGAAEALLSERLFEDVSIADIARRAGVAVGTIYLRFPSKEALVPVLFERHNAAVVGRITRLMARLEGEPSLRGRIDMIVAFAVDYHVRHRGLLRALTTYVRANPAAVPPSLIREREALYTAVARLLVGDGREARREGPLESALFAVGVVNSVCREQLLFADVSPLGRRGGGAAPLRRSLADLVERELAGTVDVNPTGRER